VEHLPSTLFDQNEVFPSFIVQPTSIGKEGGNADDTGEGVLQVVLDGPLDVFA
jgi:hypothetical protein